ncbi:MAG TPA: PEP-CTERM sorting domain-containing protein [Verrucomicrobiae bacterium]|nr:PEP-CTERM sorting domain-containing protein [Verrucomicrobiae bacterium]
MKRILIGSILGLAISVPTLSFGQGVVMFGNYSARPGYDTPVIWGFYHPSNVHAGDPFDAPGTVISLWAGTGVVTDSSLLVQIATTPLFNTVESGPGWYDMGVSQVGLGSAQIPASMWNGTQTMTFQVRAAGYLFGYFDGFSDLWQETPDTAGGSIDTISPNQMLNGPKVLVIGAPEPSAFAIAGLGLAAFGFFRSRK